MNEEKEKRDRKLFLLLFIGLALYGISVTVLLIRAGRNKELDITTNESYVALQDEVVRLKKALYNTESLDEITEAVREPVEGFTRAWYQDSWYASARKEDCMEYLTGEDVILPYLPYFYGDPPIETAEVRLSDFDFTYLINGDSVEAVSTIGYEVISGDDYDVYKIGYVKLILEKQDDNSYLISEITKISDLVQ